MVGDEFDLVVSLVTRKGYGPADGVEHVVARLADAVLDEGAAARVHELGGVVADAVRDGRRVLVRCSGGLNRSGVIVAEALLRLGHSPDEAMGVIRAGARPRGAHQPGFRGPPPAYAGSGRLSYSRPTFRPTVSTWSSSMPAFLRTASFTGSRYTPSLGNRAP